MKLRSVAVNQFRKFTTPTRLDGIGDGLNILIGPNEMGKSTLLDAIGAVFFERYSSAAKPIRALQNDRNRAAPVVHVGFELEDGCFRIEKRFLKKPYARLHCPDGRRLEGEQRSRTRTARTALVRTAGYARCESGNPWDLERSLGAAGRFARLPRDHRAGTGKPLPGARGRGRRRPRRQPGCECGLGVRRTAWGAYLPATATSAGGDRVRRSGGEGRHDRGDARRAAGAARRVVCHPRRTGAALGRVGAA